MPPKKVVKKKYVGAPRKGGEGGSPFKPGDTIVVAKRKAPSVKRRTR